MFFMQRQLFYLKDLLRPKQIKFSAGSSFNSLIITRLAPLNSSKRVSFFKGFFKKGPVKRRLTKSGHRPANVYPSIVGPLLYSYPLKRISETTTMFAQSDAWLLHKLTSKRFILGQRLGLKGFTAFKYIAKSQPFTNAERAAAKEDFATYTSAIKDIQGLTFPVYWRSYNARRIELNINSVLFSSPEAPYSSIDSLLTSEDSQVTKLNDTNDAPKKVPKVKKRVSRKTKTIPEVLIESGASSLLFEVPQTVQSVAPQETQENQVNQENNARVETPASESSSLATQRPVTLTTQRTVPSTLTTAKSNQVDKDLQDQKDLEDLAVAVANGEWADSEPNWAEPPSSQSPLEPEILDGTSSSSSDVETEDIKVPPARLKVPPSIKGATYVVGSWKELDGLSKIAHNMPLGDYSFVLLAHQTEEILVNLVKGEYYPVDQYDRADKEGVKHFKLPANSLTIPEIKRYYLCFMVIQFKEIIKMSQPLMYLLEAGVSIKRRCGASLKEGESPLPVGIFVETYASIIITCWLASSRKDRKLILIGNKPDDVQYYNLTDSLPNYKLVTKTEAFRAVLDWERSLFGGFIPQEFGTKPFIDAAFYNLSIRCAMTQEAFTNTMEPMGLAFRNGFLLLIADKKEVQLVPYTADFYSGDLILDTDYTPPRFDPDGNIILNDATMNFLKVLTRGQKYRLNAIRAFLRGLVTAPVEGTFWQCGLYIWGPGGTGKTTFEKIAEYFLNKADEMAEFSRSQNQFTSYQLFLKYLCLVSDMSILTESQSEVLRRILGRDKMSLEIKHVQGITHFTPYCQLLVVSNRPPEAFDVFRDDPAYLQKLIPIKLDKFDVIPAELQKGDFNQKIVGLMSDLANWVIYTPHELLTFLSRGIRFQRELAGQTVATGLEQFLSEVMCWSPPPPIQTGKRVIKNAQAFTSIQKIMTKFKEYTDITGDDATRKRFQNTEFKTLADNIAKTLPNFGVNSPYTKGSIAQGMRVQGFYGLVFKKVAGPIGSNDIKDSKGKAKSIPPQDVRLILPDGCVELSLKNAAPAGLLPPPFKCGDGISWYKGEPYDFDELQINILAQQKIAMMTALNSGDDQEAASLLIEDLHGLGLEESQRQLEDGNFDSEEEEDHTGVETEKYALIYDSEDEEPTPALKEIPKSGKLSQADLALPNPHGLIPFGKYEGHPYEAGAYPKYPAFKIIQEIREGRGPTELDAPNKWTQEQLDSLNVLSPNPIPYGLKDILLSFINNPCFELPEGEFMYDPQIYCDFAPQGKSMVKALLGITPVFAEIVHDIFPRAEQQKMSKVTFQRVKLDNQRKLAKRLIELNKKSLPSKGTLYFDTSRKFGPLVPDYFQRSEAPRVSTEGTTLHSMKKDLLIENLKEWTKQDTRIRVMEVDMSAAHTRVGASLIKGEDNPLRDALIKPTFWWDLVDETEPRVLEQTGVVWERKETRGILKQGTYTGFNGGNPTSKDNVHDNVAKNGKRLLDLDPDIETNEDVLNSKIFESAKIALSDQELFKVIASLGKQCTVPVPYMATPENAHQTFTLDKVRPYTYDSPHKGISRVFQSFEVIMLAVLTRSCLKNGLLPISLDHDGALIMSTNKGTTIEEIQNILSEEMLPYAEYFKLVQMPIEVKREIKEGEHKPY